MNHAWFGESESFTWDKLNKKQLTPPYVPRIRDPLDTSNFDPYAEEDHGRRARRPSLPLIVNHDRSRQHARQSQSSNRHQHRRQFDPGTVPRYNGSQAAFASFV